MTWFELENRQPQVVKMLKNSYIKNRLAHALLFSGEKGTGKKEAAILFAQMILCQDSNNGEPCGECNCCVRVLHKTHQNIMFIEPDGQTLKKEQVKYIQSELSVKSSEKGAKIIIINEIEKMSISAVNSLLKFLEEPPSNTYIILITENISNVISTVLSRVQVLNFTVNDVDIAKNKLTEAGVTTELANIIINLTKDYNQGIEIYQNESIVTLVAFCKELFSEISDNNNALLYAQLKKPALLDEKEYQKTFLDIFLMLYNDILNIKTNNTRNIVFVNIKNDLTTYCQRKTVQQIIDNIDKIIKSRKQLMFNVNFKVMMASLLLSLEGEV